MLPTVINGLPAHILLVHVIVILIPLGAFFSVLSAIWPTARRKLGFISPLTCLIALVFVPVAMNAGQYLRKHITVGGPTLELVNKHANLGRTLLPWAIGLFVLSAAVWWLGRAADAPADPVYPPQGSGGATALITRTRTALPTWVTVAIAVLTVAVSVVTVVQVIRIGDSGSKAVWSGVLR